MRFFLSQARVTTRAARRWLTGAPVARSSGAVRTGGLVGVRSFLSQARRVAFEWSEAALRQHPQQEAQVALPEGVNGRGAMSVRRRGAVVSVVLVTPPGWRYGLRRRMDASATRTPFEPGHVGTGSPRAERSVENSGENYNNVIHRRAGRPHTQLTTQNTRLVTPNAIEGRRQGAPQST